MTKNQRRTADAHHTSTPRAEPRLHLVRGGVAQVAPTLGADLDLDGDTQNDGGGLAGPNAYDCSGL